MYRFDLKHKALRDLYKATPKTIGIVSSFTKSILKTSNIEQDVVNSLKLAKK